MVDGYTKTGADAQFATAAQLAGKADSSTLATVATTGAYGDLTGQPSIPAAQVQTDWAAASGMGAILNKPALGTAAAQDVAAFATAAQGAKADTAVQPAALSSYATTTALTSGLAGKVATTITVNGKALSANVTLSAADVTAVPASTFNFTAPVDGDVAQYDSSSGQFVNSPLDFSGIAGTAALAQMTPGATFRVLWSATVNAGAGGWTYVGAYITARPTARTDIYMEAVDYVGGSTQPAFAITGDSYEVKSA